MKKILLAILACGCLTKSLAQVNFQLDLMPDRKTYVVSMVSTETWAYPQNITGTAQVTVRIPANTRFTAGRITSLQQGVQWLDNARIERPVADPTHDYVSFSLVTMATKNIPYVRGVETPLFTFQNLQNDCVCWQRGRPQCAGGVHPLLAQPELQFGQRAPLELLQYQMARDLKAVLLTRVRQQARGGAVGTLTRDEPEGPHRDAGDESSVWTIRGAASLEQGRGDSPSKAGNGTEPANPHDTIVKIPA